MFNIIFNNILITSILWQSVLSMEESDYQKMVMVRLMVFNATFNNISVISKYEKKTTNLLQVINKLYLTIIVLSTSRERACIFEYPKITTYRLQITHKLISHSVNVVSST